MFISTTIAIVIDNVDPNKMHRIKVKFTTDTVGGMNSHSSWCRMLSPMAGGQRGLVMLPEVGTEVVVGFAYRSMTPYILGAVYNGVDLPEPYRNDDCLNNVRVFWSRNDHMVVFDDTEGSEKVGLGAQAPNRLDVTSAGIHGVLDSSQRTITNRCDGDTIVEAGQTISIRCSNFHLQADNSVDIGSGSTTTVAAGLSSVIDGGMEATFVASAIQLNPSAPAPTPVNSESMPPHKHPPARLGGLGLNALSDLPGGSQGEAGPDTEQNDDEESVAGTETPSTEGDAWDELRDKTKDSVGGAVDGAVSDMIGGGIGDAIGETAGALAEKGVDAAFDAAEGAVRDAFGRAGSGGSSGGGPGGGGPGSSPSSGGSGDSPSGTGPAGADPGGAGPGGSSSGTGPDGAGPGGSPSGAGPAGAGPAGGDPGGSSSGTGPDGAGPGGSPSGAGPAGAGPGGAGPGGGDPGGSPSGAGPADGGPGGSPSGAGPADGGPGGSSSGAGPADGGPGGSPSGAGPAGGDSGGSPSGAGPAGSDPGGSPSGAGPAGGGPSGAGTASDDLIDEGGPDSVEGAGPAPSGTSPAGGASGLGVPDEPSGGIDAEKRLDDGTGEAVRSKTRPGESEDSPSSAQRRRRGTSSPSNPATTDFDIPDIPDIPDELDPDES